MIKSKRRFIEPMAFDGGTKEIRFNFDGDEKFTFVALDTIKKMEE